MSKNNYNQYGWQEDNYGGYTSLAPAEVPRKVDCPLCDASSWTEKRFASGKIYYECPCGFRFVKTQKKKRTMIYSLIE